MCPLPSLYRHGSRSYFLFLYFLNPYFELFEFLRSAGDIVFPRGTRISYCGACIFGRTVKTHSEFPLFKTTSTLWDITCRARKGEHRVFHQLSHTWYQTYAARCDSNIWSMFSQRTHHSYTVPPAEHHSPAFSFHNEPSSRVKNNGENMKHVGESTYYETHVVGDLGGVLNKERND